MAAKSSASSKSSSINHKKIAVLMGGIGRERDVSIQSGNCVAAAMKEAGLKAAGYDIRPDNMEILGDRSIDVFFLALHGKFGEDGQLQQILEDKSLIYTGSGPAASRLAFDKMASKKAFAKAGIITPSAIIFNGKTDDREIEKQLRELGDRYVIKPIRQGSSVGVSIVDTPQKAVAAGRDVLKEFGDCMVETFIAGRELTVGVLCGQALPIIEIRPKSSFYDYSAKYVDEQTEFLFDTVTDAELAQRIQKTSLDCFNALGCRHMARVDLILGNDGRIYVLEVNTIPGFTTHSLLPKAATKSGLTMSELCVKIIEAALEDKK
jgi:D-alanine-D-alanine ligase